jgi:hypothetical protein
LRFRTLNAIRSALGGRSIARTAAAKDVLSLAGLIGHSAAATRFCTARRGAVGRSVGTTSSIAGQRILPTRAKSFAVFVEHARSYRLALIGRHRRRTPICRTPHQRLALSVR